MWIYYTIGSIIFFTILNLLQRKLSVDSKNPRAMAVVFNLFAAGVAVLLFFATQSYSRFQLPKDNTGWLVVFSACFLYAAFERGRFYVAKVLDASILATIINVALPVSFIGSIILFSETVTPSKVIGGILILAALLLVSYAKSKSPASMKAILIVVLLAVCLGVATLADKKGTEYFNADTYNIFVWTVPLIFVYLPYIPFSDLKYELKKGSWKLALLAFLNVIAYFFQLKALALQEASKVFPFISTTTIFTVLLGIVLLNEKENALKKVIAGILAVIGIFFLI